MISSAVSITRIRTLSPSDDQLRRCKSLVWCVRPWMTNDLSTFVTAQLPHFHTLGNQKHQAPSRHQSAQQSNMRHTYTDKKQARTMFRKTLYPPTSHARSSCGCKYVKRKRHIRAQHQKPTNTIVQLEAKQTSILPCQALQRLVHK